MPVKVILCAANVTFKLTGAKSEENNLMMYDLRNKPAAIFSKVVIPMFPGGNVQLELMQTRSSFQVLR
jgi:hypothetical protein